MKEKSKPFPQKKWEFTIWQYYRPQPAEMGVYIAYKRRFFYPMTENKTTVKMLQKVTKRWQKDIEKQCMFVITNCCAKCINTADDFL